MCFINLNQWHVIFSFHVDFIYWYFTEMRCLKMFVLDEADEMLSRGFKDQIYDVFRHTPEDVQVRRKNIAC